jgi:hypothetical protein
MIWLLITLGVMLYVAEPLGQWMLRRWACRF